MSFIIRSITSLVLFLSLSGCASFGRTMKSLVGGDPGPEPGQTTQLANGEGASAGTTYSQNENYRVNTDRQYKRMTADEFESENIARDREGSLWVMEGQESYLFSQNIVRLPGDILNVILEGQPQKQLSTKAGVIKQLTDQAQKAKRTIASDTKAMDQKADVQKTDVNSETQKPSDPKLESFDVSQIPVRIVDRTIDGSYRVKGSQIFMIGKEEYKVIVSGLVRPGDVSDGGVQASKIVDSKFDIVRSRKKGI